MSDKLIERIDDIVSNFMLGHLDQLIRRPKSQIDVQSVFDETIISAFQKYIELKVPEKKSVWKKPTVEEYKKALLEGLQ